jgi:predicted Zn-dependent protease
VSSTWLAATLLVALSPELWPATAAPADSQPYDPTQEIRFGNAAAFRHLIPSSMLEQQGDEEYTQLVHNAAERNRLLPDSDPQVKRVRLMLQKLIPYALKWNDRAKQWHWKIDVIRSPNIMIRCMPGGKILIESGLFAKLRPNDNELAMLMGHEIAHALRDHARDKLGREQATQIGAGSIPQLYGLADLGAAPLGFGTQLLTLRYSRADETEADVIGSEIASRGGYDPRAAVTLWNRLYALTRNQKDGMADMHPITPTRIGDIKNRLSDMLPLYAKAIGKTVDTLPRYETIRPAGALKRGDGRETPASPASQEKPQGRHAATTPKTVWHTITRDAEREWARIQP